MAFTRRPDQFEDDASIELALHGSGLDWVPGDPFIDAEQWDRIRVETWAAWEKALDEGDRSDGYPPDAAAHDGIVGDVLMRRYCFPSGYEGGWDATPDIKALAEKALAEIEATPADVKAAIPARYVELIREALEHPETRMGAANPFPSAA